MARLPDRETIIKAMDLQGNPEDTRVVVAMSGGVDSSVVAGLLHHAGFDVIGITLQLYDHGEAVQRKGACCAGQDIHDARQVAAQLGFPHYVLDYEDRFREEVIEEFADSYLMGETPVPCIKCNQDIKFKDFLQTAKQLGADALATGHYIGTASKGNHRIMVQPTDLARDQSYFLFATTSEQLDFLRFPLAAFNKNEIREFAEAMGLSIATKSDSQDICFVPSGHYSDLVQRLRPEAAEEGDIVHIDGQVLGRHKGIMNYTVGQRRGLGVALGAPLYVVKLDSDSRQVIVGPKEALITHDIELRDVNWLGDGTIEEEAADGFDLWVKVRSTRPPMPAKLYYQNDVSRVELIAGEEGVAPGQACVFYTNGEGDARILGGGWIAKTDKGANWKSSAKADAVENQLVYS